MLVLYTALCYYLACSVLLCYYFLCTIMWEMMYHHMFIIVCTCDSHSFFLMNDISYSTNCNNHKNVFLSFYYFLKVLLYWNCYIKSAKKCSTNILISDGKVCNIVLQYCTTISKVRSECMHIIDIDFG